MSLQTHIFHHGEQDVRVQQYDVNVPRPWRDLGEDMRVPCMYENDYEAWRTTVKEEEVEYMDEE